MLSKRHLPLGIVLLAILCVYSNSFLNGFHFDDFHTITDNPAVRSLGNLRRIFTDTTAFSVLPANQTYRPVVTASLAVDYALGHGYSPFAFHLSTTVWFLLLVALLYLFFEQLLDRLQPSPANRWLALAIAAWFGFHPATAETVNYIIQRGDLYCTLGCVAALYLFASRPAQRRYGFYLAPFALAMLSKPPALVFPALLFFYVILFEATASSATQCLRRSVLATLPSCALAAMLLWLQAAMTPRTFLPSILSPAQYRLTQPYVLLRYVGSLFLPLHLNVDTDLQPFSSLQPAAIAGLCFVFLLMAAILYTSKRRILYPICFGLLWFVLTELPTSLYPLSEVENDHRTFFAFPGLMLAVVWCAYLLYQRLQVELAIHTRRGSAVLPRTAYAFAVLCLCGYGYGAHRRNAVWRSEDTLWADDVEKSPHNGRGLMIYGLTRMNAGDLLQALALYTRALEYTPRYPTLEINLGVVNSLLAAQGRPTLNAVAEQHFVRAIALAPADDTTHAFYGRWLLGQDRTAEAVTELATAVRLNPQRAMQRDLLLEAYEKIGNPSAAHQLALRTIALFPSDTMALAIANGSFRAPTPSPIANLINASLASYRAGQFQRSVEEAEQALRIDPHSAEAWNNVGAGSGALRQWKGAIAAERQALALNPHLDIAQNNLRWFLTQQNEERGIANSDVPGSNHAASMTSEADLINRSLALYQQRRYTESIAAAQGALMLNPASAEGWNNIAADDAALARWDEAIAAAQRAVALKPGFQLAQNNLAWALQQKAATARTAK